MKDLVLIMFLAMVLILLILLIISVNKKRKKERVITLSDKEVNEVVNDTSSDSGLSTSEIINKFHVFMGYPYYATGLNRTQRRIIKQHHIKFLWNWHLLTDEQQNVKKVCEFLISTPLKRGVFNKYRHKK